MAGYLRQEAPEIPETLHRCFNAVNHTDYHPPSLQPHNIAWLFHGLLLGFGDQNRRKSLTVGETSPYHSLALVRSHKTFFSSLILTALLDQAIVPPQLLGIGVERLEYCSEHYLWNNNSRIIDRTLGVKATFRTAEQVWTVGC